MKSIPCEGKVMLTAVLGGGVVRAAGDGLAAAAAARAGVAVAAGGAAGVVAGGAPGAQAIASATLASRAVRRRAQAIGTLRGRRGHEAAESASGDRRSTAPSWPGALLALRSV